MTNFIGVYEDFCSDDYCDRMVDRFNAISSTASCYLGEIDNDGVANRKDISINFRKDADDLFAETNQILDEALKLYLDEYPSLATVAFYSNDVKVQRTRPKGGFHRWHFEQGSSQPNSSRCLVWMIYLNNTSDGEGTTEFLEFGEKLQPKKGTVVMFPASWTHTHRGNPVYSCDKYIATGWYYLG